MKLYSYHLPDPLDWEFCFLSVDEYKAKIEEKYEEECKKYKIDCTQYTEKLSKIYFLIDKTLIAAEKKYKKMFTKLGYDDELRLPPMIFPIPKGAFTNAAVFCIVLKRNEDGDTFVYSPVPLPHLEYR